MALTFSEGSIGGDIEKVNLGQLEAFYGGGQPTRPGRRARRGRTSNPPARTASRSRRRTPPAGHALLLINPHTSFFFRAEAQMVSEEGLNAYGALTWGQFFIYQGFNDRAGWMHTSSGVDAVDEYAETVVKKGDAYFYRYGTEERPVKSQVISVPYKTATGMATKDFTIYRTHHGPIVRQANDKWIAIRLMQEPLKALMQSYSRTKARNLQGLPRVDGPAHQLVEQHDLRGRRRHDRLLPRQLHPAARPEVRLDASRSTAATRPPSGAACCRWTSRRSS